MPLNNAVSSAIALVPLALAQVPAVGASELGNWLLACAAAAVIANQGMMFFKNLTGSFARKQTPSVDAYQSLGDCEKKHALITKQIAGISGESEIRFEKLRLELKDDVKGIHKRIDDVLRGVSRLEGKTP